MPPTPKPLLIIFSCNLYSYELHLNHDQDVRHKGLHAFFESGTKAGIQPHHATRLRVQLTRLDVATSPRDMNAPGWNLHPLIGGLDKHWAITVNGNWRLTFTFLGEDVILVDYLDYH